MCSCDPIPHRICLPIEDHIEDGNERRYSLDIIVDVRGKDLSGAQQRPIIVLPQGDDIAKTRRQRRRSSAEGERIRRQSLVGQHPLALPRLVCNASSVVQPFYLHLLSLNLLSSFNVQIFTFPSFPAVSRHGSLSVDGRKSKSVTTPLWG